MYAMVLLLTGAYLIGSIPFTFLYGRACGHDIRKEGSCNVGGTNLVRVVGARGIPGVVLDVSKGALAVLLARYALMCLWHKPATNAILFAVILAATIGHMFSVFLGFRGGKGVAVAGGGIIAVAPGIGVVIYAVSFLAVATLSDMMSVGSVAAAAFLPIYSLLSYGDDSLTTGLALTVGLLVIWAHRGNLMRIREGTEKRLGFIPNVAIWVTRRILILNGDESIGFENIPRKDSYLLVSNHLCNADPLWIWALTGQRIVFVAKKELWYNPILVYILWLAQAIRINRQNPGRAPLDAAVSALHSGKVVGLFPEGHRNRRPELGLLEMSTGAAFIASQAKVEVLPVSIAYPYTGKRGWIPRLVFGELITNPDNLDPKANKQVLNYYGVKKTRDAIHAEIVESLTRLCVENGAIPE
jgi:glycerol-3-phosphate acyltransferase PlsY